MAQNNIKIIAYIMAITCLLSFATFNAQADENPAISRIDSREKQLNKIKGSIDTFINSRERRLNKAKERVSTLMNSYDRLFDEVTDHVNTLTNIKENDNNKYDVPVSSDIAAQPYSVWASPVGDVVNDSKNRCRVIKVLKPGADRVMEAKSNTETLLVNYATDMYVDAVETLVELDNNKDKIQPVKIGLADDLVVDEHSLLNNQILARLAAIATRLNIVASLEARTSALDNINKLSKVSSSVYQDYVYDAEEGTCQLEGIAAKAEKEGD